MTGTDPIGGAPDAPSNPYGPAPDVPASAGADADAAPGLPGFDGDAAWKPPGAGLPGAGAFRTPRRRGPSRGVWIALAASIVVTLVLVIGVCVAFVATMGSLNGIDDPGAYPPDPVTTTVDDGTVLDASGNPVLGIGTLEDPATVGEHSLRWPSDDGGTITVHVTSIDWDADAEVEAADPLNDPSPDGYVYVLVSLDVTYAGTGWLDAYDSLMVSCETPYGATGLWETMARPAQPLWRTGGITDGETASGQVVLAVLREDVDSTVISISTWSGTPLSVR